MKLIRRVEHYFVISRPHRRHMVYLPVARGRFPGGMRHESWHTYLLLQEYFDDLGLDD